MTVFRLYGFGALGPFATDQHLTILHAVINVESEDKLDEKRNKPPRSLIGKIPPVPRNEHGSWNSS